MPDFFDVFVFFEVAYESINFEGLVKLPHFDFGIGKIFESARFRNETRSPHSRYDGGELFGIAYDAGAFRLDAVVFGIGCHDRLFERRHVGNRTEIRNALVSEGKIRNRAGFTQSAAVFGKNVPYVRGRAVAVVGQPLRDDGDATGTVAFVVDFFDLRRVLVEARAAFDGTVDVFGRNVVLFGGGYGVGKVRILRRITSTLCGESNKFRVDAEDFSAEFRGEFLLALHDGSASHGNLTVIRYRKRDFSRSRTEGKSLYG